jgi:hypothetical protein
VYDIEESEYVRKADVDEAMKQTRLQGLKDQLAEADADTTELQAEIEDLEQRIADLTSFDSGSSFHTRSAGGWPTSGILSEPNRKIAGSQQRSSGDGGPAIATVSRSRRTSFDVAERAIELVSRRLLYYLPAGSPVRTGLRIHC